MVETNSLLLAEKPRPLLLDAAGVAAVLNVSKSAIWNWCGNGLLPAPIRLGRRTLWRQDIIAKWVSLDCPSRDRFEKVLENEAGCKCKKGK